MNPVSRRAAPCRAALHSGPRPQRQGGEYLKQNQKDKELSKRRQEDLMTF